MSNIIEKKVSARIPIEGRSFTLTVYEELKNKKEHLLLSLGDIPGKSGVLTRIHSECLTGDVFGSQKCDCRYQLNQAIQHIAAEGQGAVLYLRQEGRGIGLVEKLKAYNLQEQGYDTVEANIALGHQADLREFSVAQAILKDANINSVKLITNNPHKIQSLESLGVKVEERVTLPVGVNKENKFYLETKARKLDHFLNIQLPQDQI